MAAQGPRDRFLGAPPGMAKTGYGAERAWRRRGMAKNGHVKDRARRSRANPVVQGLAA